MNEVPMPEIPNERPFHDFVDRLLESVGVKAAPQKWVSPFKKYEL